MKIFVTSILFSFFLIGCVFQKNKLTEYNVYQVIFSENIRNGSVVDSNLNLLPVRGIVSFPILVDFYLRGSCDFRSFEKAILYSVVDLGEKTVSSCTNVKNFCLENDSSISRYTAYICSPPVRKINLSSSGENECLVSFYMSKKLVDGNL